MSYLPVVLVPGFRDDERKVAYLARRLRAVGFAVYPLSPQPSAGEVSLEQLAEQLPQAIDRLLGAETRFHLFGFSMGSLIGRYYIQMLGGANRVEKFVTLAAPNRGSWMAYLYPERPACRQMTPDCTFLTLLNYDLSALTQVKYTSIWSRLDLTIVPPSSSRLPVGASIPVYFPIHGWLLRSASVVGVVVEEFLRAERDSELK